MSKSTSDLGAKAEHLRFSTAVLRLLGEELNPSPDQGILELIKNSYDADAKKCTVELKSVHVKGGAIRFVDDGIGMTPEEIRNGWLVVGDSMKARRETSPSGRLLVGSKGLGRLGALRLGRKVELVTRPKSEPKVQYRMEIDWARFDDAKVVEDVELEITREEAPIGTNHGTELVISQLPLPWTQSEIKRLARSILLLRDPFAKKQTFQATLKAEEFEQLERLAHEGYFTECEFHLVAEVDKKGHASAEVLTPGGKRLFSTTHNNISVEKDNPIYGLPPLKFELWEFKLSGEGFAGKEVTLSAVRRWLEQFGGVRLYHRGVRVLPYGEPKNDWLDMNLRRSQHQELRPSTNNSLGVVWIEDPSGVFQQKTDRLGFVESNALDELRRFTDEALDWMSRERRKERDRRKAAISERVQKDKSDAEKQMDAVIGKLPPAQRKDVAAAVKKMKSAHDAEVELKEETTLLYFTLGTIGTTAAAFAHQTKVPIRGIMTDAKLLQEYLGDPEALMSLFRDESSEAAKRIHREAGAVYSFSSVTLRLLEHEKRRSTRHSVHQLLDETVELLRPYLEARDTAVERDYAEGDLRVWCPRAAFEAIFTNLFTNSLQAFEARAVAGDGTGERRIQIQTRSSGGMAVIRFEDNGPGINSLSIDDIWLPGKTTTEKGTGLGLTIVKDVVQELRGSVKAEAHGDLRGAAFTITLPLKT